MYAAFGVVFARGISNEADSGSDSDNNQYFDDCFW